MSASIQVKGLKETVRSLERLGIEVRDLKGAFKRIGQLVVTDAQARAPHLTGALAQSIRPSNTKNKSVVRAGSAKVPYAGVQQWGWPAHSIAATNYLTDAVDAKQAQVLRSLEEELRDLINKLDLK